MDPVPAKKFNGKFFSSGGYGRGVFKDFNTKRDIPSQILVLETNLYIFFSIHKQLNFMEHQHVKKLFKNRSQKL